VQVPKGHAAAVARHAPELLNGQIEGSLWLLSIEDVLLSGNARLSGDLLVPGTPTAEVQRSASLDGILAGEGSELPAGYRVRVNGNAHVSRLVTRTDPVPLLEVAAPPAPQGTRDLTLSRRGQSVGDFATLRNLTLAANAGAVAVPPGTYGTFRVQGTNALVLGVAGAAEPAVYNLQLLWLEGNAELRLAGPVIINLAGGLDLNGVSAVGDLARPHWLELNVAGGEVQLNGRATLSALILAPASRVGIYNNSRLRGMVWCDRLAINGHAVLEVIASDPATAAGGGSAQAVKTRGEGKGPARARAPARSRR
jgi:hypothetical protein